MYTAVTFITKNPKTGRLKNESLFFGTKFMFFKQIQLADFLSDVKLANKCFVRQINDNCSL